MKGLLIQDRNGTREAGLTLGVLISFGFALSFLCLLALAAFISLEYNWNWEGVYKYRVKFVEGWVVTVGISAAALVASCLIGGVSALATKSKILPLRYLFKIYVEVTRGTPLLVQMLMIFYVFADAIQLENRYVVGILILSLFSGAYVSEIFRAGIESVGSSQLLSAKSIGFTPYQTFRYVVFPQALRRSLPALTGQFANLIKDSSLLSIIAISEFTLNAQEVNTFTVSSFESFFPLAVGYMILTLPIFHLSRNLEKRLAFES